MKICRHSGRVEGFSLVELLIVMTVAGVLATLATPAFREQIENRRIKGAAENLYANLQFARSEAVKRNRGVHVNFTVTSPSTWCYGLTEDNNTRPLGGAEAVCNCATTPANCTVNGVQKVVNSTDYTDVQVASDYDNTTAGNLSFDTVRGTINTAGNVTFSVGSKQARVRTTVLGQVQICAPSGSTLFSYQSCP